MSSVNKVLGVLMIPFCAVLSSCGSHEVKVEESFVYTTADFPQCHASTIVEYPKGMLSVAFFGGTRESADDVCIYLSRKKMTGQEWSRPEKVAEDSLVACWNPVLFASGDDRMLLFYKTGPHVPEWVGHVKTSRDGGFTWTDDVVFPEGMLGAILLLSIHDCGLRRSASYSLHL